MQGDDRLASSQRGHTGQSVARQFSGQQNINQSSINQNLSACRMGPRSNLNSRNALPGAAAAAPPAAAAATSAAVSAATAAADRAAPAAVAAAARSAAGNAAAAAAAAAAVGCGVGAADRLACPLFRRFLQGPEGVQQMRSVDAGPVTCPTEVMTCRQASGWGSGPPSRQQPSRPQASQQPHAHTHNQTSTAALKLT